MAASLYVGPRLVEEECGGIHSETFVVRLKGLLSCCQLATGVVRPLQLGPRY